MSTAVDIIPDNEAENATRCIIQLPITFTTQAVRIIPSVDSLSVGAKPLFCGTSYNLSPNTVYLWLRNLSETIMGFRPNVFIVGY